MLTALIAAAVAASPVTAQPDPAKDQVAICVAQVADKLQSVASGGPPISFVVPLYTDKVGMSAEDAKEFQHVCDLFEKGFLIAVAATKKTTQGQPMDSDGAADEGRAPDYSTDPTTFPR